MSRFIAFDVGTPNRYNNRMSAIGIAVIENGVIVTADEKAILVVVTTKIKLASTNDVMETEDSSANAHEISIAEALELWKD